MISGPAPRDDDASYAAARGRMVRDQLASRGIVNPRVLAAMGKVPRHRFVPADQRDKSYEDGPLPIGDGQTISQPYIVALMTQVIDPQLTDRVLEIGAGSGYQTAILAELVQEVIGIERIPALADRANARLAELGYHNVTIFVGDGSAGLPEFAPYNTILVAATAPEIPQPLVDQLADEGRLVLPVGSGQDQRLEMVVRHGDTVEHINLIDVRFVPLIGQHGYQE
jgi:protein-L-isoaspartate(D-aspartate) O-methyltransferase